MAPRLIGQTADELTWQDDEGSIWGMPRGLWPQGTPLPSAAPLTPAPMPPVPPPPDAGLGAPALFGVPQELLGGLTAAAPPQPPPEPMAAPPIAPTPALPAPAADPVAQVQQSGDVISGSIERQGQIKADTAAANAEILGNQIQADMVQDEEDTSWMKRRTAELDQRAANVRGEVDKLANLSTDPRGAFGDDETGSLVLRAIMGTIGGWLAPDTGGRNTGLEMIDRIIERRMQAQQANIANRRAALGDAGRLVAEDRAAATDMGRQMAAKRAAAWERTARLIEQNALRMQPGIERESALQLAADARAKGAVQVNALEQEERKLVADEWEGRQRIAQGWAAQKLQRDAMAQEALARGDAARAEVIGKTVDPDGLAFVARDTKQADEIGKQHAATMTLNQGMDEMVALRRDSGGEAMPGPMKDKLVAQGATLVAQVKAAEELGALDKGSGEFVEKLFGDPTSFLQNPEARIEQARKYFNGKHRNRLQTVGFRDWDRLKDGWWKSKDPSTFNEKGTVDPGAPTGRRAPAGLPATGAAPAGAPSSWQPKPQVAPYYSGDPGAALRGKR